MNMRLVFTGLIALAGLSGCWLDEASAPQKKSLFIVADHLSSEDSSVMKDFGKTYHVDVHIEVLKPEAILQRVRSRRYNADMDILLTENQALRRQLQELQALKHIRNNQLFGMLERQFNNQHHQWVPLSHDPLVLITKKDTNNNCSGIDFRSWHRSDSLRPIISIHRHAEEYRSLLGASSHLNWLRSGKKQRKATLEQVYALSELVELENGSDSLYHSSRQRCRYFVIDNQRYLSRVNSASIYRHGRNAAIAENFLAFLAGHSYAIANGRNHLPTRKNIPANWYIRSLSIQ